MYLGKRLRLHLLQLIRDSIRSTSLATVSRELRGSLPARPVGAAFYPVLVHRSATSIHASSPRSVALPQLRFSTLAVTSSRQDFHPQECAHAGRTGKKGV